jgi:hypothetical protein
MIVVLRFWDIHDYNEKENDINILFKRPRVDYRISEYIFEHINEKILKKYKIMQNENYQIELSFYNKKTIKNESYDFNDIYDFREFDFFHHIRDLENNIKWHKLINIKCYSDKFNENIKPKEYAGIVYNMICAYLSKKYKRINKKLIIKTMSELDYKHIEEYAFPALFLNQKYLFDDPISGKFMLDGMDIDIKKEYMNHYKELNV